MKIETYEDAILRIKELEKENKQLKAEVEELKNRKMSGRKNTMTSGWNHIMILLFFMNKV